LGAAGRTPGCPDVEQGHLALEAGAHADAVAGGEVEDPVVGGGPADGRAPGRGGELDQSPPEEGEPAEDEADHEPLPAHQESPASFASSSSTMRRLDVEVLGAAP